MANLITAKQAADKLGVSTATIRRWCEEQRIPGAHHSQVKIGSGYAWLMPEESLDGLKVVASGKRSPIYGTKG